MAESVYVDRQSAKFLEKFPFCYMELYLQHLVCQRVDFKAFQPHNWLKIKNKSLGLYLLLIKYQLAASKLSR